MDVNRTLHTGILAALLLPLALAACSAARLEEPTSLKEMVINAMTVKSLENASRSLQDATGDEGAQKARQVGERLVALSGKKVKVRIIEGSAIPKSLASGEILIPAKGMGRYNEEELNFILAHELAHVHYQHLLAAVGLAAQACPESRGDTERYILQLAECIQKNHDRPDEFATVMRRLKWRQEHEADLWAVRFLKTHNLAGQYKTVLKSLNDANDNVPSDTHPSMAQRRELIDQMIINMVP